MRFSSIHIIFDSISDERDEKISSYCCFPSIISEKFLFLIRISDCRQSPRLFAGDFAILKMPKVCIFAFQPLFSIIEVSKKTVFFYDNTVNRKSKNTNADGMY